MNFYELQAFITLADSLHFGKAAAKLNMSPSALSRIVSRLEDEMQALMIDRSNRQVVITEQGKLFYKFAKDTLQKQKNLAEEISGTNESVTGTLQIYASVTACYTILPDFLKKLSEKYPDIHFSIETGDPAAAIELVKEGKVALAVGAIPESGISMLETVSVTKTPLVYAASKNGPYTQVSGSPQDIVSSVPLILPKTGIARTRFDKWIKSRNVKPTIAAVTEGNEAIMSLVQLGLGIGLVPQIVLENGPFKGEFISHIAGNTLGYYNVGFIKKTEISGTKKERQILEAVDNILRTYK